MTATLKVTHKAIGVEVRRATYDPTFIKLAVGRAVPAPWGSRVRLWLALVAALVRGDAG